MSKRANHQLALVESEAVGDGTRVWAFAHVMRGATVGRNCNVGGHVFIEAGAVIGDNVTIKNHVCIWDGVTIEDGAFIGPHVTFSNDRFPRSPRMPEAKARYEQRQSWLSTTRVGAGCSIGANSTVLPGIVLGDYSMIAAGSVVTRDVPPHALVMGVPAQQVGVVCRCGARLADDRPDSCHRCGLSFASSTDSSHH